MAGVNREDRRRGGKRAIAALAGSIALLALLALAGCSGTPDASGDWEIAVPAVEANVGDDPQDGNIVYATDLQQDEEGNLSGDATATVGEYSCDYEVDEGSSVSEDGDFTLNLSGYCDSDASWQGTMTVELDGKIEGDEMTGEADNAMPASDARESLPESSLMFADGEGQYVPAPDAFTGERGSGNAESELASSNTGGDSGEETVQSSHGDLGGSSTIDEQGDSEGASDTEIRDNYETLRDESDEMARDIESRISTLDAPEEDLGEALGPDTRNPDTFDCAAETPSCVAASLEDYLEQDRATFEEEGFGPEGCEAANGAETYADYENFDASGGESYITERERIEEAAEDLEEDARVAHSKALDMEAARDRMIEADVEGQRIEPSYREGEVQSMAEQAAEAEREAMSAVENADERYESYESRASSAIAEAEALHARAGCGF